MYYMKRRKHCKLISVLLPIAYISSLKRRQKYEKELITVRKEVVEPLQKAGITNPGKAANSSLNNTGGKKADGEDVKFSTVD